MIVIPFTPSVPDQQFTVQIGESQYTFRALWNERARLWHFDVFELDGTPIRRGIAIVLGAFLGRASTHPLFTEGAFIARDRTSQTSQGEAGLDDLGARVEVRYYRLAEFAAQLGVGT